MLRINKLKQTLTLGGFKVDDDLLCGFIERLVSRYFDHIGFIYLFLDKKILFLDNF